MAFKLDEKQLRALYNSPQGPVWRELKRQGDAVKRNAQILCPVGKTGVGRLKKSIVMEMDEERGLPVARVGTNVDYALFVHEGTGIYGPRGMPIRPKRARVLKWPVIGTGGPGKRRRYKGGQTAQFAYAKQVKGVPGRPFLRTALEQIVGKNNVTRG